MFNYATKSDLKQATGINISRLAKEAHLTNLKSHGDRSNFNKLKTTPVDLSKLSNIVKNNAFKKRLYDELVRKDFFKLAVFQRIKIF